MGDMVIGLIGVSRTSRGVSLTFRLGLGHKDFVGVPPPQGHSFLLFCSHRLGAIEHKHEKAERRKKFDLCPLVDVLCANSCNLLGDFFMRFQKRNSLILPTK